MQTINTQLLDDIIEFGAELMVSQDLDPLYPVLRELYKLMNLDTEQSLWFSCLYLAYYNVGSALAAFRDCPQPSPSFPTAATYPCAVERRGLRGGKIHRHLRSLCEHIEVAGSIEHFLTQHWRDESEPIFQFQNYLHFWETAQSVWNNGRWAAFKWGDLLKNVHHMNLAAPDMRMKFCTGPKEGLELLFGLQDADVITLNAYGLDLLIRFRAAGVKVPDWETLETILCNFKSLAKGKYYVGHDIDELQAVIHAAPLSNEDKVLLYKARAAALPHSYLGEKGNKWQGVDSERMKAYAIDGTIAIRISS